MKRGSCLFLFFILIFVLPGMRAEPAVKTSWSSEELTEDYRQLWQALRENYPFLPVLERQGTDPAELEAEYLKHVRTCGDIRAYCRIIDDMFFRMGNTAHLGLFGADMYEQYQELVRDGIVSPESPAYSLVRDGQTAVTYGLLERSARTRAAEAASAECSYDAERGILVLKIPSFRQELVSREAEVLAGAVREHPDVKHIIFDIRGNTGGSVYYWMNNLVAPFGEAYTYRERIYCSLTPLNLRYGLDRVAEPLSPDDGTLPAFVKELGFTHSIDTETPVLTGDGGISCSADRWVLTDGSVFSAADSFVSFCKSTGFATVVGTRTRGDGDGESPYIIRLPETGLLVRFSTTTSANEDGSLNAVTGHAPDFPCKPGETAMDACLRLIGAKIPR